MATQLYKKRLTIKRIDVVSSVPHATYAFVFSDNLDDWMYSHKSTRVKIRKRNEAYHEDGYNDFKHKHG